MRDRVHGPLDRKLARHVGLEKLETGALQQCSDVLSATGGEVVDTDHGVAPIHQAITYVRAYEAGAACDDYTHASSNPLSPVPLWFTARTIRTPGGVGWE